MQGSPETIDPQLLKLCNCNLVNPNLSEQQHISHHASVNPPHGLHHARSNVEEETASGQASIDREYDRHDSDELEILGHFDFG